MWLGRQTNSQQRKIIQKLAAEKFAEGYYKLRLDANPLQQMQHFTKSRKISLATEKGSLHGRRASKHSRRVSVQQGRHQKKEMIPRPDHSLLLLLYEGSEWVIFREKFNDWPDDSRIIRMKGGPAGESKVRSVEMHFFNWYKLTVCRPKYMYVTTTHNR